MSYYKLLVFKMGRQKEDCDNCASIKCQFLKNEKCKLYSCHECGRFIDTGETAIRVVFQATKKMETRRQFLYGKGFNKEPKEAVAFVTYHKDCYLEQLSRWIEEQARRTPDAILRV